MSNRWLSGGLLAASAFLSSASSHAEGLRCGEKLASHGASLYEVRAKCGEPDDAQRSIETRTLPQRISVPCAGNPARICEVVVYQSIQISIDRWTYDFGNNRFIEFAIFEQGNLVKVTKGPYGQKPPQSG
jgi:hypothetical protein